jgi:hypothetical protein
VLITSVFLGSCIFGCFVAPQDFSAVGAGAPQ